MSSITPTKPSQIAREILNSISIIDKLLKEIYDDYTKGLYENTYLDKIRAECDILHTNLCGRYEESPNDQDEAFKLVFTYPSRFKSPATLLIILSFIYGMIIAYEKSLSYVILRDPGHIMHAQKLSTENRLKIKSLLK